MTKRAYKKAEIHYYANQNNPESALENGSFVRWSKQYGYARFILGDFHEFLDKLPDGLMEVPREKAESLIPKCCI